MVILSRVESDVAAFAFNQNSIRILRLLAPVEQARRGSSSGIVEQ